MRIVPLLPPALVRRSSLCRAGVSSARDQLQLQIHPCVRHGMRRVLLLRTMLMDGAQVSFAHDAVVRVPRAAWRRLQARTAALMPSAAVTFVRSLWAKWLTE